MVEMRARWGPSVVFGFSKVRNDICRLAKWDYTMAALPTSDKRRDKLSKDLDCYEKGRKKMGFRWSKDLKLYDDTEKKSKKSWVSHKVKIWIVISGNY